MTYIYTLHKFGIFKYGAIQLLNELKIQMSHYVEIFQLKDKYLCNSKETIQLYFVEHCQ